MDNPIATTALGKVKGKVVRLEDGRPVHVFRNIPFAKPPIGTLRFKAPEPPEPWDGIKDGTKFGNLPMYDQAIEDSMPIMCPLPHTEMEKIHDEDCLHLSIFTPAKKTEEKLAVMVWYYGGGFFLGSERHYDGSVLAGMNDVIVVVPNYRVGVFGFFSLGKNSCCPGNAGLHDQHQALRWVQEHIESFGGDKDNVTIFGESAGGAAVHLNVLSPAAKGLFHKAISHSGQATMAEIFMNGDHIGRVKRSVMKKFEITATNDEEALAALQKIPAKKLLDGCAELLAEQVYFIPSIDGVVIPKSTKDIMKEPDKIPKIPYLVGCNNTEGDGILNAMSMDKFKKGFTAEEARMATMLPVTDEGYELLLKRYLREEDGETKYSRFLGRAVGEGSYISGVVQTAITHADAGADVYCYLGCYQLMMNHDKNNKDFMTKPDWCECDHGDDIPLTFGHPFSPVELLPKAKYSEEEKELSRTFMVYLTNFAKTGDPNKGKPVKVQWPKYKRGGDHLILNHTLSTVRGLGMDALKFWSEVIEPHKKAL